MDDSLETKKRGELDEQAALSIGSGLLGFSPRPLDAGDFAYYAALGLSEEQVNQVVFELREGMSPLTRGPKRK
jgi:hypothetical protein